MDELTSNINIIQDNMDKIEARGLELEEGSKKIVGDSSTISNNLNLALEATKKLNEGATIIDVAISQVIDKLNQYGLANFNNDDD